MRCDEILVSYRPSLIIMKIDPMSHARMHYSCALIELAKYRAGSMFCQCGALVEAWNYAVSCYNMQIKPKFVRIS